MIAVKRLGPAVMLWMIILVLCFEMSTLVAALARRTPSPLRSLDDNNYPNDELNHPSE